MKDYYSILGVTRSATPDDIRRRYRRLALQYHPDKNPDPSVTTLFQEINEAYDILSDPIKRRGYDYLLDNLSGLSQEEEEKPKHRDPAYRRPPSNSNAHHRPTTRELMQEYLPYFRWLSRAGVLLTMLIFLDILLPTRLHDDEISEVFRVRGRRQVYQYDVMTTKSGRKFVMYDYTATSFPDPKVHIEATPIFSVEMSISDREHTNVVKLGYIYGGALKIFPMVLFLVAMLAILQEKRIEFAFNANIVCGVLIVILLYLLS